MVLKNKILLTSGVASLIATVCGITATFMTRADDLEALVQVSQVFTLAGIFGLLGIALFFVGWVYPILPKDLDYK